MATIVAEVSLRSDADTAWMALSDFGAAGELFAGVLVDCKREGDKRTVTFANGLVASEQLVTIDHASRRFVYSVLGAPFTQHSASMQIVPEGDGCRFVWISDFLPDEVKSTIEPLVAAGCDAFRLNVDERTQAQSGQTGRRG
jgi:hypothetical protein